MNRFRKTGLPGWDHDIYCRQISKHWGWLEGIQHVTRVQGFNQQKFVYAYPNSPEDRKMGRTCVASGLWFPGRLVTYVDGQPYGTPFAPTPFGTGPKPTLD